MSSIKRKSAIALAWDFSGLLINRGSGFIISVLLARLLSPEEFGLVGMAMVFIALSKVFVEVGFASALIQNENNSDLTYSSVFFFNIFSGFALTLFFYLLAPFIGSFYDEGQVTELVRLLSLTFIFNAFNQVQSAILTKQLNFKALTLRNVVASIAGGLVGVFAAYMNYGVYALVIQSLVNGIFSTILLWSISKWKPSFQFSIKELKKLLNFSTYVFFDRLLSRVFAKLDVLLIGKIFSPASLGFYTRAASLKDQVTVFSSTSISKVFFPVLSSLQKKSKEYESVYFKVISVVTVLSFLLTGILLFLGEEIIITLLGSKWQPSVPIFEILILAVSTYPLNSMMINAFISKGMSKMNFKIGILRKAIQIIPLSFIYFYGIYEYTIATVIISYLTTVVNVIFLKLHLNLSIKKHLNKFMDGLAPLLPFVICFYTLQIDGILYKTILTIAFLFCYLFYNYYRKTEAYIFIYTNLVVKLKNLRINK